MGKLENYGARDLATVRRITANAEIGPHYIAEIDGNRFLRFCAGLLWKFSVTKKHYGRITLGRYQSILRRIAFDGAAIPQSVDALIIRWRREAGDTGTFAYQTPFAERKWGINFWRFVLGRCEVFVQLDKRTLSEPFFASCLIRDHYGVNIGVAPAHCSQAFREAPKLWNANPNLSDFLDKQDRASGSQSSKMAKVLRVTKKN